MAAVRFWDQLGELADRESLRPDFGRAARATVALMAPLMMALAGKLPFESAFAVIAAQNVAMIDVRGAYRVRFSLLAAIAMILAACSGLGGLVAGHLALALAGMAAVAVLGGLCRHLSNDYGPSIAIASVLLYAYALVGPGGAAAGEHHLLDAIDYLDVALAAHIGDNHVQGVGTDVDRGEPHRISVAGVGRRVISDQ